MVSIIVAHSKNRVIGCDGGLPWQLPSDLKRFRALTTGGVVVMGRRTFESLPPAFRPLPNRHNLVVTTNDRYDAGAAEVATSLEAALRACADDCFVIGGGSIYVQALPVADRIFATEIEDEIVGDVLFPTLSAEQWDCVECTDPLSENGHSLTFKVYDRRR